MGQARYYSTDPRRASVSGYAGASDPLVRPDSTGAAPDKPGVSTVGLDEQMIRAYIKNQEREEKRQERLRLAGL